jgi:transposase InsO family protein
MSWRCCIHSLLHMGCHTIYVIRSDNGPEFTAEVFQKWLTKVGIKPIREPPHLNWSSAMFRKRRTDNDEQTTEAGRDYHEVEAS